jgi:hypothetical protein
MFPALVEEFGAAARGAWPALEIVADRDHRYQTAGRF